MNIFLNFPMLNEPNCVCVCWFPLDNFHNQEHQNLEPLSMLIVKTQPNTLKPENTPKLGTRKQ